MTEGFTLGSTRARKAILLSLVLGLLTIPAASASAAGWLAPTGTAPGSYEVEDQDLELDAQGNAVAAWTVYGPQW